MSDESDREKLGVRGIVGWVLPVLFLAAAWGVGEAPWGLEVAAWRTACVGLAMAVLWVTEVLPIPVTALLPILLFPLLGVADIGAATAPFGHKMVFLYFGGFVVALAMERWGLHRRIALRTIAMVGTSGRRLILGFMVACAFLSMWVSNTATTLMMLPIALSVVGVVCDDAEGKGGNRGLELALLLGIAYSASIGGMATLIGTPPNALLAGYLADQHGVVIGFAEWMLVGLPLVIIGLPLAYVVLTRVAFKVEAGCGCDGEAEAHVRGEIAGLGKMSRAERWVALVFVLTALSRAFRPLLAKIVPGLSDTGIAVGAAVVLFALPSGKGGGVMDWETTKRLPWGVLLLFGGGLSLAAAVKSSGLAEAIGQGVGGETWLGAFWLTAVMVVVVLLLTELTSNLATTAAFLPVVGAVASGIGMDVASLAAPVALAASGAFMLPVATPPNAVVFGSGRVPLREMVRAGVWLNVSFAVLMILLVPKLLKMIL
ncbi:MAG: DASS family sodium-coupled anion symporter [Verrucomicrobiales bacterium]|nr:DASS family sodium-coupled anion symporter [Verrucomicrobiales bacterium]